MNINQKQHVKLPIRGKLSFIYAISLLIAILVLSGCQNETNPVTLISLDFPHGGLRLHVPREGDTRLFYGAFPSSLTIKDGTFDIDELFQQLQPRLEEVLPAENRPIGQPYGMVTFIFSDGSEQNHLIYNEAFAEALMEAACENIAEEEDAHIEIFTAECANLSGTP